MADIKIKAEQLDTGTSSTQIPTNADLTINNNTITLSAGTGISGGGSFTLNQGTNDTITVSHSDTTSQGSVNNSGNTVIQDITLDEFGHIINIDSASIGLNGVSWNDIGSVAFGTPAGPTILIGTTLPGSQIAVSGDSSGGNLNQTLPGTWRLHGAISTSLDTASVWVRIS